MTVKEYNKGFYPKIKNAKYFINFLDKVLSNILQEDLSEKQNLEQYFYDLFKIYGWNENTKNIILDALEFYREKEGIEKLNIKENNWENSCKEDIATCSVCGYEHYLGTYRQYATNFCPNCGSKMQPIN